MINPEQLEKNPEVILVIKGERINARYISPTARRDLGIRTAENNAVFVQEQEDREYMQVINTPYFNLVLENDRLVRLISDNILCALVWRTNSLKEEQEMFDGLHGFLHPQEVAQ